MSSTRQTTQTIYILTLDRVEAELLRCFVEKAIAEGVNPQYEDMTICTQSHIVSGIIHDLPAAV